uniref:Transmembrane protein n=1 Tax=Seculamonas ecuadoriensis TaxID=221724 RepID=M4QAX3_SECEC|nr:hypothetical protein L037_mgp02 [Seculamonas ecuadoriensis]AGH24522.1 hypothetical protein [Seculamonas ecuadoriensis]
MWSLLFMSSCFIIGCITYFFVYSSTESILYINQSQHVKDTSLYRILDKTNNSSIIQSEIINLKEQNSILDSICLVSVTEDHILKYIAYEDYYLQFIQGTKQIQTIEQIQNLFTCYIQIESLASYI